MERKKVLLVPECGGEAGFDFIQYCKIHYTDCIVIALDRADNVPGKFIADKFYQVPDSDDEGFREVIEEIITVESVTHLIPTFEHGLPHRCSLSEEYGLFTSVDFDKVLLFKDKYETAQRCKANSIPTIATEKVSTDSKKRGFDPNQKLYIKPKDGSGSKDNYSCEGYWEYQKLHPYLSMKYGPEDMIVQPFTEGVHWSVDICVLGEKSEIVLKKGLLVVGSKIVTSEAVDNKALKDHVSFIIKQGSFQGVFNIEFIEHKGIFKLLEINTRLSGGMIYSIEAGMSMYDVCLGGAIAENRGMYGIYYKKSQPGYSPVVEGVKVLLKDTQGKVLLTKRADVPFRTIPGGGIKIGETQKDAAKREIEEELGYKLYTLSTQCTVYQKFYTEKSYVVFRGSYDGSELQKQDKEVAEIEFFSLDELPYPMDSVTEEIITQQGGIRGNKGFNYHKNVHIRYEYERQRLLRKPVQGILLMIKVLWNRVTTNTFRI